MGEGEGEEEREVGAVLAVSDKRILPRDLGILVRVRNGNTRRRKAIQRILLNTIQKGIYLQKHC